MNHDDRFNVHLKNEQLFLFAFRLTREKKRLGLMLAFSLISNAILIAYLIFQNI